MIRKYKFGVKDTSETLAPVGVFLNGWGIQEQNNSNTSVNEIGEAMQIQEEVIASVKSIFTKWSIPNSLPPTGGVNGGGTQFSNYATSFLTDGTTEDNKFFYHPDHLGSTSYVTDADGQISQHEEYIPFGESFVSEYKNSNQPWKYNAKELDEDTQLYYYGARFYDPKMSLWLSVDPLVTKTGESYVFCGNNPIRYVDPTGLFKTRFGAWLHKTFNGGGTSIQKNKYGQYYYHKVTVDGDVPTVTTHYGKSGRDGNGEKKTMTPYGVGWEWLTGTGHNHREFNNGDWMTEKYRQCDHFQSTCAKISTLLNGGSVDNIYMSSEKGSNYYDLAGTNGAINYVKDYSTVLTGGLTGNIVKTYLGSHDLSYQMLSNDIENKIATYVFTVTNSSDINSLAHPPIIGYTDWWRVNVRPILTDTRTEGIGHPKTQAIIFTQKIRY